ncbi:MAG: Gfo/Idh/MocA family oxidoreductase [Litorimonas sp.]
MAIVGMGRWGEILVRSVQGKSGTTTFTAVVTRSPDRIESTARDLDLAVYPDLESVLADPSVHGIVVTTPHSSHAPMIAQCRRAGRPVFVEKPFTLTRASADAALEQGDSMVFAAHNRRFLPSAVALFDAARDGELGDILHIEANFSGNMVGRYTKDMWRSDDTESPGGGLAGSGIHMIDLIVGLAGSIESVHAMSSRRVPDLPIDDTMAAMFRLTSGASASLSCVAATASCFRFQVFGTKGSAELRGAEQLTITALDGSSRTRNFVPADIERLELEAFSDAIQGRAEFPVTLEEVLNGVSAFEGISRSLKAGAPVSVREQAQ